MSQVTNFDVPGSPLTMSALATSLEAIFAALGSINRGAAAPSNPFEGMLWWDSAATVEILKRYTVTAGWISILSVNRSTGVTQLISTTVPSADTHVVRKLELDTHAALTSPHSATSAATASRIALRDASGNIKIGTAAADTDALNRITADGRFGQYSSGSDAAGGDFTGTIYWFKVGSLVTLAWNALSHSSNNTPTSGAVIPSGFRPAATHNDAVYIGTSYLSSVWVSTAGVLNASYRNWSGAGYNATGLSAGSTSYRVA